MKEKVELRYPYNLIERIGFYDSKIFNIPYGTLTIDQNKRLEECLLELDDLERQAILLKYKERMSNKQIVEALGKSQSTILSYLRRAIIKLKTIKRLVYILVGDKLPKGTNDSEFFDRLRNFAFRLTEINPSAFGLLTKELQNGDINEEQFLLWGEALVLVTKSRE